MFFFQVLKNNNYKTYFFYDFFDFLLSWNAVMLINFIGVYYICIYYVVYRKYFWNQLSHENAMHVIYSDFLPAHCFACTFSFFLFLNPPPPCGLGFVLFIRNSTPANMQIREKHTYTHRYIHTICILIYATLEFIFIIVAVVVAFLVMWFHATFAWHNNFYGLHCMLHLVSNLFH